MNSVLRVKADSDLWLEMTPDDTGSNVARVKWLVSHVMASPIEQPSISQTDAADMLTTSAVRNQAFHGLFTTDTWPRRVVQDSVAGQTATDVSYTTSYIWTFGVEAF